MPLPTSCRPRLGEALVRHDATPRHTRMPTIASVGESRSAPARARPESLSPADLGPGEQGLVVGAKWARRWRPRAAGRGPSAERRSGGFGARAPLEQAVMSGGVGRCPWDLEEATIQRRGEGSRRTGAGLAQPSRRARDAQRLPGRKTGGSGGLWARHDHRSAGSGAGADRARRRRRREASGPFLPRRRASGGRRRRRLPLRGLHRAAVNDDGRALSRVGGGGVHGAVAGVGGAPRVGRPGGLAALFGGRGGAGDGRPLDLQSRAVLAMLQFKWKKLRAAGTISTCCSTSASSSSSRTTSHRSRKSTSSSSTRRQKLGLHRGARLLVSEEMRRLRGPSARVQRRVRGVECECGVVGRLVGADVACEPALSGPGPAPSCAG